MEIGQSSIVVCGIRLEEEEEGGTKDRNPISGRDLSSQTIKICCHREARFFSLRGPVYILMTFVKWTAYTGCCFCMGMRLPVCFAKRRGYESVGFALPCVFLFIFPIYLFFSLERHFW